jgi:hypothetical protein
VSPRAEAREHEGQVFRAYVHVFAHATPQHHRGNRAAAALFFGLVQDVEDDAFAAGEPVADVGETGERGVGEGLEVLPLVILAQGLNSVLSFFLTATPLIFTYWGKPSLYGG